MFDNTDLHDFGIVKNFGPFKCLTQLSEPDSDSDSDSDSDGSKTKKIEFYCSTNSSLSDDKIKIISDIGDALISKDLNELKNINDKYSLSAEGFDETKFSNNENGQLFKTHNFKYNIVQAFSQLEKEKLLEILLELTGGGEANENTTEISKSFDKDVYEDTSSTADLIKENNYVHLPKSLDIYKKKSESEKLDDYLVVFHKPEDDKFISHSFQIKSEGEAQIESEGEAQIESEGDAPINLDHIDFKNLKAQLEDLMKDNDNRVTSKEIVVIEALMLSETDKIKKNIKYGQEHFKKLFGNDERNSTIKDIGKCLLLGFRFRETIEVDKIGQVEIINPGSLTSGLFKQTDGERHNVLLDFNPPEGEESFDINKCFKILNTRGVLGESTDALVAIGDIKIRILQAIDNDLIIFVYGNKNKLLEKCQEILNKIDTQETPNSSIDLPILEKDNLINRLDHKILVLKNLPEDKTQTLSSMINNVEAEVKILKQILTDGHITKESFKNLISIYNEGVSKSLSHLEGGGGNEITKQFGGECRIYFTYKENTGILPFTYLTMHIFDKNNNYISDNFSEHIQKLQTLFREHISQLSNIYILKDKYKSENPSECKCIFYPVRLDIALKDIINPLIQSDNNFKIIKSNEIVKYFLADYKISIENEPNEPNEITRNDLKGQLSINNFNNKDFGKLYLSEDGGAVSGALKFTILKEITKDISYLELNYEKTKENIPIPSYFQDVKVLQEKIRNNRDNKYNNIYIINKIYDSKYLCVNYPVKLEYLTPKQMETIDDVGEEAEEDTDISILPNTYLILEQLNDNENILKTQQPKHSSDTIKGLSSAYESLEKIKYKKLNVDFKEAFATSNPKLQPIPLTERFKNRVDKKYKQISSIRQDLKDYLVNVYFLDKIKLVKSDSNVFDIKNSVEVSDDEHGDSIITSLLKGGIILNPANQKYAGGGVYSDHPHNAMEENLCRQSDLITSILKFIDIKFPDGYDQRKKLMFLGQSGKNTYGNVQKCLVSENTFKYIKEGNNFKELEHPQKRIVLSIASPNMKKFKTTDLSKSEVLNQYKTDMESYWKLAIAATIDTYKKSVLDLILH